MRLTKLKYLSFGSIALAMAVLTIGSKSPARADGIFLGTQGGGGGDSVAIGGNPSDGNGGSGGYGGGGYGYYGHGYRPYGYYGYGYRPYGYYGYRRPYGYYGYRGYGYYGRPYVGGWYGHQRRVARRMYRRGNW